MQWLGRRQSSNVDDRRGVSGGQVAVGGGDISDLQQSLPQGGPQQELTAEQKAADDERAGYVGVVFADTEDVWDKIFAEQGKQYDKPTLVLFHRATQSACGSASSATGPFTALQIMTFILTCLLLNNWRTGLKPQVISLWLT